MRRELIGRATVRFQRVLAGHFHVTAQRQGTDAVVGVAFAEAHQALAKTDGEDVNPDAK
jgi:hypothetical protein